MRRLDDGDLVALAEAGLRQLLASRAHLIHRELRFVFFRRHPVEVRMGASFDERTARAGTTNIERAIDRFLAQHCGREPCRE
jgi:hypothetical protein